MSDYIPSPAVHTAVHTDNPEAVAPEFNHLAIDLNRPDLDNNREEDSSDSDCESVVSVDRSGSSVLTFVGTRLMELNERDMVHRYIKERFLSPLGELREKVSVVAIHQNCDSSFSAKARAQAFQIYSEAVQKKSGGDTANVKYAWYAVKREEIFKIFSYGFGYSGLPKNSGLYGCGLYFAPYDHPHECAKHAPIDEDGLRYLLLCQVILGKSELVNFGSEQTRPSSEQYDSGVDNLSFPTRYIVWSTHMNSHVLPEYVVSFRAPYYWRGLRNSMNSQNLNSLWVPFRILIVELSMFLRPSDVRILSKYYKEYKGGRISRPMLVQKIRQAVGDGLLADVIRTVRIKQSGA